MPTWHAGKPIWGGEGAGKLTSGMAEPGSSCEEEEEGMAGSMDAWPMAWPAAVGTAAVGPPSASAAGSGVRPACTGPWRSGTAALLVFLVSPPFCERQPMVKGRPPAALCNSDYSHNSRSTTVVEMRFPAYDGRVGPVFTGMGGGQGHFSSLAEISARTPRFRCAFLPQAHMPGVGIRSLAYTDRHSWSENCTQMSTSKTHLYEHDICVAISFD